LAVQQISGTLLADSRSPVLFPENLWRSDAASAPDALRG
jgi:hypothetical protein